MESHILKQIKLYEDSKYVIFQETYKDGSVEIVGGFYKKQKYGVPFFVGCSEMELPDYIVKKIHEFEKE